MRSNRYSTPYRLIGHQVEVRESKGRIEVFDGPRIVASHTRVPERRDARVTDLSHRPPRGEARPKAGPSAEESALLLRESSLAGYVTALKKRASGRGTLALRRLLRMLCDYPREPLLAALRRAEEYGLYDLDRVERLILRQIATDYFQLPAGQKPETDDEENGDE